MSADRASFRLLAALALASCLGPLGSTSIAVALPSIGRDFDADPGLLTQWLVASYLVTAIALQSPGGKLGDLWGHRRALSLGQLLFALGSIAGFLAPTAWALAGARILTAAGGAVIAPAAIALVRSRFPAERRARAFGVFGATMSLSAALGPLLGGELTTHFGWRAIFVANLPPLAASVVLARGLDDGERRGAPPRIDAVGALLVAVGLAIVAIGPRARSLGVALAGVAILAMFALWERRAPEPVVDLGLFRRRAFAAGTAVITLQNMGMYALLFELPMLFSRARGVDAAVTGRTLLALMIALSVVAPIAARLSERVGARAIVASGGVIAASGAWLLRDAAALAAPADAVPGLILLGIGLGACMAPSQAAAIGAIDAGRAGMAAGLSSTMRYLGGIAGVTVLGIAFRDPDPARLESQHAFAVGIFIAAFVASAACALALPSRSSRHGPGPAESPRK